MAIQNVPHQILEAGDKVKMDIKAIQAHGEMDGIETTESGVNYLKYMLAHPDEVYTVTALDFNYENAPYILSGAMGGNNWAQDELIYVPKAQSRFEVIKNMSQEEMASQLLPMVLTLCEEGVPCKELVEMWLAEKPTTED